MAIISGIHLPSLRNSEFSQFSSDVLELVKRNDPAALKAEEAYNAFKAENDNLTNLLNPEKGSMLTAQIEAADDRRDEVVTGINFVVLGYTHHYDPITRNHAVVLQRNLSQYGGGSLARENYQSESAGISSMLADWDSKPELAAALTALNLDGWKDELALANKAFNDLYMNRNEEVTAVNPVSVRAQRVLMGEQYFDLRDLIASYHTIFKGAAPYGATVNQLNGIIDKYSLLLAGRKGKPSEEPEVPLPA
jgi:hypothetical protein